MTRSPLEDIADAILDGTAIDWSRIDAEDAKTHQALLEQLKTLAALRQAAGRPESPEGMTSWGHLRVLERIGSGAFGHVYRAWDTRLDREVALKLLSPDSAGGVASESHVIEEGRLLARIRHPNVVTIYGAERIDGRVGLWMEIIKGRTLEQALRDGKTFDAREVTRIGAELCRAVAAVHAAGLLHRDVKAQNVMVDETGRLVLMDFGTGRELDGAAATDVTGTPLYLAPEVLAGGAATARSEVYSIGVVLYHLLTGSYPVHGRGLEDLKRAHAAGERAPLPGSGRDIPQALRRAIARALDRDPERRYAGAAAFGNDLAALQHSRRARRWAPVAAAAIVTVTASIIIALGLWARPVRFMTPVIAVMPFKDLGPHSGNDGFVDGLTTEVIHNLAMIDGLQVQSQTAPFAFRDKPRDLRVIADQRKANLIVEADVLRTGNRLRIDARLVKIPEDVQLWSKRFDGTLEDVFAFQDGISSAIVNKLGLTPRAGPRQHQAEWQAYEKYLHARAVVSRRGTESALQAARLFEEVIERDQNFALAYAGLADAYAEMSWQLTGLTNEAGLRGMKPAAERALRLDPELAEAHAAMGVVYARELKWSEAVKSFERALARSPNLAQIRLSYADTTLVPTGQLPKALQLLQEALKEDPQSPTVLRELGWVQFESGRFDEAIESFRMALAGDPALPYTTQGLARALTFAGRPTEAIDVWTNRPASDGPWERWLAHAYQRAGRHADLTRLLEAHRNELPYRKALIYSALGDKDATFKALNESVDQAPQRTAQMLIYPEMALLVGDPRLDALRRRLNLQ